MKIEEKVYKTGYSLKAGENYIELIKHEQGGYDFNRFKIKNVNNKKLINELGERFHAFAETKKCIIQSEDTERDREQSKFLVDFGFVVKYSKINYQKNLTKHTFLYDDIFQYCSINDSGVEKFFGIYKASVDKPYRSLSGFIKYYEKTKKEDINHDIDESWKIVLLKNKPIGTVMPARILTYMPPKFSVLKTAGTLLGIGLIPEERGKGYGRIIHSKGLVFLKDMGLKLYVGSTRMNNYAMQKVFKINKCRKELTQNFYHIK